VGLKGQHLTEQRYAPHERQASPDKDIHPVEFPGGNPIQQGKLSLHNRVIYRISEPRALTCCAALPRDWALYAISVPRIESGAGLAHSFALRLPSDTTSR
jgi:hypothetical protein